MKDELKGKGQCYTLQKSSYSNNNALSDTAKDLSIDTIIKAIKDDKYSPKDLKFQAWGNTLISATEAKALRESGVVGEGTYYELREESLPVGHIMEYTSISGDQDIVCIYRFGIFGEDSTEQVVYRKYTPNGGTGIFSSFSPELHVAPLERFHFLSERELYVKYPSYKKSVNYGSDYLIH